jgi:hypothetical protein
VAGNGSRRERRRQQSLLHECLHRRIGSRGGRRICVLLGCQSKERRGARKERGEGLVDTGPIMTRTRGGRQRGGTFSKQDTFRRAGGERGQLNPNLLSTRWEECSAPRDICKGRGEKEYE